MKTRDKMGRKRTPISDESIRAKMLGIAVRDFRTFGWPRVTVENVMTDRVYKLALRSQLAEGLSAVDGRSEQHARVIREMIAEIDG
jgi:hypothetical protein